MKEIKLTQGKVALVDDCDFERLSQWKWRPKNEGNVTYADSHTPMVNGIRKRIKMHRIILGLTDPKVTVDHINGDGLDNRRCNLRLCTQQQNSRNTRTYKTSTTGIKGVSFHKPAQKFSAYIMNNYKKIHLGLFRTIEDAAIARKLAEKELHGEYARS